MDFSRMRLYHATDEVAAQKIKKDNCFRPGTSGFAGPAIYFSERPEAACRKCRNGRREYAQVVIACDVNVGKVVIAEKHVIADGDACRARGGNSVRINPEDVWAIYDPGRIKIVTFTPLTSTASLQWNLSLPFSQFMEQDAETERQAETEQYLRFEKDYKEWGKGELLGVGTGGKRVVQGDATGLRDARLARLQAVGFEQSTTKAARGDTGIMAESSTQNQSGRRASLQSDPVSSTQEPDLALSRLAVREADSTVASAEIHSVDEVEDEDIQKALLLSLQLSHSASYEQCPSVACMEDYDLDLERALFLSKGVASEECLTNSGDEDEDLSRAIQFSLM